MKVTQATFVKAFSIYVFFVVLPTHSLQSGLNYLVNSRVWCMVLLWHRSAFLCASRCLGMSFRKGVFISLCIFPCCDGPQFLSNFPWCDKFSDLLNVGHSQFKIIQPLGHKRFTAAVFNFFIYRSPCFSLEKYFVIRFCIHHEKKNGEQW